MPEPWRRDFRGAGLRRVYRLHGPQSSAFPFGLAQQVVLTLEAMDRSTVLDSTFGYFEVTRGGAESQVS